MLLVVAFAQPSASLTALTSSEPQSNPLLRSDHKDRTTPFLRRMTPAQREHARLMNAKSKSASRILDAQVSLFTSTHAVHFSDGTPTPPTDWDDVLAKGGCDSDVVLRGTLIGGESFPVEDGTWLFTETRIIVTSEIKRRPMVPIIHKGEMRVVVRPGGSVDAEGIAVSAGSDEVPPVTMGTEYLFFLEYISKTGAFTESRMPFAIKGNNLVTLTAPESWSDFPPQGIPLERATRVLAARTCR